MPGADFIVGAIVIFAIVVFVGYLILPQIFNTNKLLETLSVTNSTLLPGARGIHSYTLNNLDPNKVGTLTIIYSNVTAGTVNVTYANGTVIGTLDGTSPDTFTLSAGSMTQSFEIEYVV